MQDCCIEYYAACKKHDAATDQVWVALDAITCTSVQKNDAHLLQDAPEEEQPRVGVRVSTVDNYQGEEARIVLVSLVRSNTHGQIGFLKEAQRVNVLLSRARDCLILIGNADTLRTGSHSTRTWSTVLRAQPSVNAPRRSARQAGPGFEGLPVLLGLPACCERHSVQKLLQTPQDFAEFAPAGGCTKPCNAKLPCGHICPARCHAASHGHAQCQEVVDCQCAAGLHPAQKLCSATAPPACREKVAELCRSGEHTVWRLCVDERAPRCNAPVLEECRGLPSGEKHMVQRRCWQPLPACQHCRQAEQAQKRLHEQQERQRQYTPTPFDLAKNLVLAGEKCCAFCLTLPMHICMRASCISQPVL